MKVTYAESNAPVRQVAVENGAGYFDLVLNKNRNGKAIRISDRFGNQRVHITLDQIDDLVDALTLIEAQGKKTSVSDVEYDS